MFNDPIRFRLNGKRAITTTLGGVLTIAIIIFIISQIGAEFVKMFNYDNPQIYEIAELEDNPEIVHFNHENNFFIAIVVMVNSAPINMSQASVINFQTTFNKYTKQEDGTFQKTKYPVYWAPCNESDFLEEIYGPDVFLTNSLNYGYCTSGINFTNSTDGSCPENIVQEYPNCIAPLDFEIQGTSKTEQFNLFQCTGVACDSNDPTLPYGMVCDTEANVNNTLTTKEIKKNIYYPYSLINSANYQSPNITFIDNVYWNLNPSILKLSDIFVDRVTIQDFDSWIFDKEYRNRSFYSIPSDKMRELEESQPSTSRKLIEWNLRRSSLNTVVSRTYIKITGILTDLGGFTKALIFIAAMVSIGFIKFRYNMLIANELYDFKFPYNENEQKEKLSKKNKKNLMLSIDYSDNKILAHHQDLHSFSSPRADFLPNKPIRDYAEKLNMKRRRLDISEWGYLKMIFSTLCCKKDPEEDLAKKSKRISFERYRYY